MKRVTRGYTCKFDWPDDCHVQCGGHGIVLKNGSIEDVLSSTEKTREILECVTDTTKAGADFYRTAFFEAFPSQPQTFIRGEGESIEIAEEKAWSRLTAILSCKQHEYTRGNYRNGVGICKHCKLFSSDVFEPMEVCYLCGANTYFGTTRTGTWYCEACQQDVPDELLPEWVLEFREYDNKDEVD